MEIGACLFRGGKALRAACCIRTSARVSNNCRWNRFSCWLLLAIIKVTLVLAFAQVLFWQASSGKAKHPKKICEAFRGEDSLRFAGSVTSSAAVKRFQIAELLN